jgi:hypothetical protein
VPANSQSEGACGVQRDRGCSRLGVPPLERYADMDHSAKEEEVTKILKSVTALLAS